MAARHHLTFDSTHLLNNASAATTAKTTGSSSTGSSSSAATSQPSSASTTSAKTPSTATTQSSGSVPAKSTSTAPSASTSTAPVKTNAAPVSPPPSNSSAPKSSSNSTNSTAKPSNSSSNSTAVAATSSSSSGFAIVSNGKLFGLIEIHLLIKILIIVAVVALILFIILKLYRRYRTKKDYNQNPQIFSHKPDLSIKEKYYINNSKIQGVILPERISIKENETMQGHSYEVTFTGQETTCVYFHRRQITTCYFEIQVLKLNGFVEIGYVPCDKFDKIKNSEENIGNSGVGVTTTGFVQAQGQNIFNYSWILAYGDVIGMGLSRQNSKFNERRAWISKNGVLLNYPPMDQMDKWIATIEISTEEKEQYNLGKEKAQGTGEQEEEDEQTQKKKAQKQKIETNLKKQRISLKTFNSFQYYPVILCHGNKGDNDSTIININVGGQIFRMHDAFFRHGLLKDKSLFGDD